MPPRIRALPLYLRSGVNYLTTSVDLTLRPGTFDSENDLTFERLSPSEDAVAAIVALERSILGFARETDIRFILTGRPAWLATRAGKPAAYACGVQPNPPGVDDFSPACGPMAALDPADMPALIDHVMSNAGDVGDFLITVPCANQRAVAHLLKRHGKIDPFDLKVPSDDPTLKLDRFTQSSPPFIL